MSPLLESWLQRYVPKVEVMYAVVEATGHQYEVVEAMVDDLCAKTGRPESEVLETMYGEALAIV